MECLLNESIKKEFLTFFHFSVGINPVIFFSAVFFDNGFQVSVFAAVMDGCCIQIVSLDQNIFPAADPNCPPRSGTVDDGISGNRVRNLP